MEPLARMMENAAISVATQRRAAVLEALLYQMMKAQGLQSLKLDLDVVSDVADFIETTGSEAVYIVEGDDGSPYLEVNNSFLQTT